VEEPHARIGLDLAAKKKPDNHFVDLGLRIKMGWQALKELRSMDIGACDHISARGQRRIKSKDSILAQMIISRSLLELKNSRRASRGDASRVAKNQRTLRLFMNMKD